MINNLNLKTFVVVWLLMSRGSVIDSKDILLMDLYILLFVDYIFDYIGMTEVSLIQIGLKICEKWRSTSM